MKFSIIVNKWANFYFFVQNLSEWHFSNRKEYNNFWREELGPLSPEEENALEKFKEIRRRYKPAKTPFESAFFIAENPWAHLEKTLNAEEYESVKKIFSLLENKFGALYAKDLPLLTKWQEALNNKINDPTLIKSISKTLCALYNTPTPENTINVYLLFSAANRTGGGANIDEQSVSVEISRYPLNGLNHVMGIIWHEMIHLYFEKRFFVPFLEKKFLNDKEAARLVREITASALFPAGILAKKYLNLSEFKLLNARLPAQYTKPVVKIAENYIEKNQAFNDEYIKNLYSLVSSLKGIVK